MPLSRLVKFVHNLTKHINYSFYCRAVGRKTLDSSRHLNLIWLPLSDPGLCMGCSTQHVPHKTFVLETNKSNFRFEPKQTETRSVSRLFRFVSWNQNQTVSVCFGVSNLYRNNRKKQNCFVTNRNNPNFSEKYPNILSFMRFGWVFCLFQINWNSLFRYRSETTETPKQTVSKQTEKTEKKPEKNEKKTKKPRKKTKKTEKTINFL